MGVRGLGGDAPNNEYCSAPRSATNDSSKRASYSRNIVIEKTENALVLWVKDLIKKRIPVYKELIQEKARQYFNQLKDLEPSSSSCLRNVTFSARNGWFTGFLQRYALHNVKLQGEAASADEPAAMNYRKVLAEIIDDGGYCSDQVFNADETGLFWKKMPSRTFIAKYEKTASGFKAEKDRITLLLCSNASGAKMLTPLIINKALYNNPESITADKIYAGFQISKKLETHFLKKDTNAERRLEFQKELRSCMSQYRDVYKQLTSRPSSQKLITDFMVPKTNQLKSYLQATKAIFNQFITRRRCAFWITTSSSKLFNV
ncbi:tigger transposable element-derived protein 1-like [Hylaeus volcanicus]|uniref:tigger transposable element-derived protein 1-like n=1 Tax=Hylaeus volcanicus TaxID=313075 RepID=UPI0023B82EFB|nr:tigger transposable element-derived protein 1-like [Hylaeus volcanicus]